jgi:hypothetical protein
MMTADLRALARLGATSRLSEIEAERQSLYRAFPDLAPVKRRVRVSAPVVAKMEARPPRQQKRRRRITAAQRRAVSQRMKRYWAARRGEV